MASEFSKTRVGYEPWVGASYEESGLWGQKVLVVGESHYDEWAGNKHSLGRYFTGECVKEIIAGVGGAPFWAHISNRIGGAEYRNKRPDFWQKISFYNFIQSPLVGKAGKSKPTQPQLENANVCLSEVLEILQPHRVIVNSFLVRNNLAGFKSKKQVGDLQLGILIGSKQIACLTTPHPRSGKLLVRMTDTFKEFIQTGQI